MKKRYFLAADPGIEKQYSGVIVCMSTTDNGVPVTEETRILKYHNCTEEQRQAYFEKSLADIAGNYKIKAIPEWILKLEKEGRPLPLQGKQRGSYVSRSVYQKLKEENKKLLADIKALVNTEDVEQFCEVSQKWIKHFAKEDQFSKTLKEACGIYKQEHPEEFPNMNGAIAIPNSLVHKLINFMHPDNLAWFKSLKDIHGTYAPVLRNGPIPHPVHLREGMQIRNFLRTCPECKTWTTSDYDDHWTNVIDLAVKLNANKQ